MAITIREFGVLTATGASCGLDAQCLADADFALLKQEALAGQPYLSLISRAGNECVRVGSHVGVITLSTGTQIEVLPKMTEGEQGADRARGLLLKMLTTVMDIPFRESGMASLNTARRPWLQSLIDFVLGEFATFLRGGLRSHYQQTRASLTSVKGKLDVAAQIQQRPGNETRFQVCYDEYTPDRPENRLLKSALLKLLRWSETLDNNRKARELLYYLDAVPASGNTKRDLQAWKEGREMQRYRVIKPWVALILENRLPFVSQGEHQGLSLLFPMERLYEAYLGKVLKGGLPAGLQLREQISRHYLAGQGGQGWFRLCPDLAILRGNTPVCILDAKWKLLDSSLDNGRDKYGLSQADFYQLFAYGHRYLPPGGHLFLIYPKTERFNEPLPVFDLQGYWLHVVPFCLGQETLVLPDGAAIEDFVIEPAFTVKEWAEGGSMAP